jgi:hypothetical protein
MRDDPHDDRLGERLRAAAAEFPYPPTPDLAPTLGRRPAGRRPLVPSPRRIALPAALALAVLLAALLAVPEVRGAALRLLQVGVVRVRILPGPAPTPAPAPSATPPPAPRLPALVGATTLEAAAAQLPFPILLPAYPADLGAPAAAFVQEIGGPALVLVWADPGEPGRVRLSLHALSSRAFAEKLLFGGGAEVLEATEVAGEPALWVRGPHLLRLGPDGDGEYAQVRLVEGDTLIWTAGEVTYRLESDLSLDEARRVAESLRPQKP